MTTSNDPSHSPHLRLRLTPVPRSGVLDGAWWPHSSDLEVELAELVDHFPPHVGRISRVIFSRPDWATHPHQVRVARGTLKTGSFPRDDTHVVLLRLSRHEQLTVLVVPLDTAAEAASDLMAAAADPANDRTGAALLAQPHQEADHGDVHAEVGSPS